MKFTVLVLNGVLKLSNLLTLDLEFEKTFNIKGITSNYDLPILKITNGSFDNQLSFNNKKINLSKKMSLATYLNEQLRKASDADFFGLYDSKDTLEFKSPIGDDLELEIHYNVKKKFSNFTNSDVLVIVDNEPTNIDNSRLIDSLLDCYVSKKIVISSNSSLNLTNSHEYEPLR